MTNSTPKMNDRVERQGSPNAGPAKRHAPPGHRTASIKSSTYFSSANRHGRNGNGRLSCSPPLPSRSTRNSPVSRTAENSTNGASPRGSPQQSSFYAGAKFSEPPSPASLPKPPMHWTTRLITSCQQQSDRCRDITDHLKMILNVQA